MIVVEKVGFGKRRRTRILGVHNDIAGNRTCVEPNSESGGASDYPKKR